MRLNLDIQEKTNQRAFARGGVINCYRELKELFFVEEVILKNLHRSIRNKRLLDIGIGGGRTTKHLLEISNEYTGIDYSSAFVRIVHATYPQATVVQADARDLRMFGDSEFDFALFSYNGIDYISHSGRLQALSEIHRVLRPGGFFMFSTHNLNYKYLRKGPWRGGSLLNSSHRRDSLFAALNWPRHLIMKRYELDLGEYAIVNDSAHGYSLLTYYIGIDQQVKQLRSSGFDNTRVFDLNGNEVNHSVDFSWIYYLTTKTSGIDS